MNPAVAMPSSIPVAPYLAAAVRERMMPRMSGIEVNNEIALERDVVAVATLRDRASFARLFDHYAPRVKAYLRRLGADDGTAEDLAQEVLVAVWRRAHQFDPAKAKLSTWVFTIARNKRIDAIRRERRLDFDPDDPALAIDDDGAPRGDRETETGEMRRIVLTAVSELPVEQAQMLKVFYFEDKPHSVIADELGLPLGTVKSRLRLALCKLRVILSDLER